MVYTAKLLRVNLTTGTSQKETIAEEIVRSFVGGRGLGIKYLYQELAPGIDPLSADNKLLFAIGPLAGTGALAASRWMVVAKSPLTNTYFRSVAGADFGAWLGFAGIDLMIIEGKAAKPVYLYIKEDGLEIKEAAELWGKGTIETQERLKQIHGDRVRIACIGPAGEKLVRYSAIMSDRRTAGRGGMGTVMGSKNLKAIVIDADRKVELPNPEEFGGLIKEQAAAFERSKTFPAFSDAGTPGYTAAYNRMGFFPVANFRYGTLEGYEKISQEEYAKLKVRDTRCYACSIHCGNEFKVTTGPYAGAISEGPDYETIWAFTGSICSTDIGATIAADALCDDLGLDTISTGSSIGFAFELFEKGILTQKDTDGLNLVYGNHEVAIEMIKRIAQRQGLGDVLAEGVRRAAAKIGKGAEAYAMHMKGLEAPGYEPRALKVQGLSMATSNIGASHCFGYAVQEIYGVPFPHPVDRFADGGYSDVAVFNQDALAMREVGILCTFAGQVGMRDTLFARMLASATGIAEFGDTDYLAKVGEKIYNLERAFNLREGLGRQDDSFPQRMLTEPLRNAGPAEGQIIRNPELMLNQYYSARGWDKNGIPTADKLKQIGLEEIISDMEEISKRG